MYFFPEEETGYYFHFIMLRFYGFVVVVSVLQIELRAFHNAVLRVLMFIILKVRKAKQTMHL